MKNLLTFILLLLATLPALAQQPKPGAAQPLRVGIAGLTHDHVHDLLRRAQKGDIQIVGIAEPNKDLATRRLKQYKLPESLWFSSLEAMVEKTKPEAVCAFNSIYEHRQVNTAPPARFT